MRLVNGRGMGVAVLVAALGGCGTLLGLDEYSLQTCEDGVKGEGEADVDCGGICGTPCGEGQGCAAAKDCASLMCGSSGRCEAASCGDGVKNGGESDVDCGGSCGSTCGPEADCKANGDCVGGACEGGMCTPTCTDKAKSGDESDVDCGGPTCDACELGQGCATAGDCKSGVCHAEGCVAEHVWSMRFGDAQEQTALSVVVDSSGNVIVAGAVKGIIDFGGGPLTTPTSGSYFVTKRDSAGNHMWSKLFGDPSMQSSIHVSTDSMKNVIVACTSASAVDFGGGFLNNTDNSDIYIAKLDAEGNHVWSKAFTSMGPDRVNSIKPTPTDSILIAGEFSGAITFGGGILTNNDNFVDVFVAELENNGAHVWSKSYQASASLTAFKLALDGAGNILLGGGFFGSEIDFGGSTLTSAGGLDVFLAKLSPFGEHIWSKRFGSTDTQTLLGLSVDSSGNVLFGGHFYASFDVGGGTLAYVGGGDAYAAKLGPSGNHLWSKRFGDAAKQQTMDVEVDSSGKLLLVGSITGTADFGGGPLTASDEDIFLVALTQDGAHLWSRRYGGPDTQAAYAVATDDSGNVVVVGDMEGFVDFGGKPLVSAGLTDIYTAKLAYP